MFRIIYLLFFRFSIVMNLTEKNWSMSLLKPQTKVGLSLKMCAPYRLRSKTRMTTNQFLTGVNMMNLLHKTRLLARKSCVYQQLMLTRVKIRKSAMIYQPPEFQVCWLPFFSLLFLKIKTGWVLWCSKVQISNNRQLCINSQSSTVTLQIWTLLHHNTQPVLIFNRKNLQNIKSPNGPIL